MIQTPEEFMRHYEHETSQHHLAETLSLIAENAVYLFSDGSVHIGKPAIEQVLRHNFDSIRDETYSITNLSWLVNTADAAVCVFDFSWSGLINGKQASGSGRGTSTLISSVGGWRVIHEHLSRGESVSG